MGSPATIPNASIQTITIVGKPKGARNHTTRLMEALLDGQALALGQRAVELAMAGDASVMRALLDRIISPRRDRPVSIAMPKIECAADLIGATAALTAAATAGEITPSEAGDLVRLVEGPRAPSRSTNYPLASPSSKSRWP